MRSLQKILVLTLSLLLFPMSAHAEYAQHNEPGVFDYYLLNLSWEPEFCHSRRNADSQECRGAQHGFVVHGLWPQFTKGYPEHCSHAEGPRTPAALLDVMPTTWLAQHEWSTHGTCSGLNADDYFALVRRASKSITIPEQFAKPARRFTIAPSQVKAAFVKANPGLRSEDMAISCGNNYLTAVEFCMNKNSLQTEACTAVRDCHANVITVAPVQ